MAAEATHELPTPSSFAEYLKQRRMLAGVSKDRVAREIGAPYNTYVQWEKPPRSGKKEILPSLRYALRLIRLLKMDPALVEELCTEPENPISIYPLGVTVHRPVSDARAALPRAS